MGLAETVGEIIGVLIVILVFAALVYISFRLFKWGIGKFGRKAAKEEEPKEKRKLSAIMFTDMKGFSKEVGKNETVTLRKLWRYEKAIKEIIKEHDGRVVKTIGDAMMGDFDSAVNAVNCAIAIQKFLKKEDMTLRIGIHLGDVVHKGGDIFGDGVNIASRIESITAPGEIYISEEVYRQVKGKISAEFEDLGRKKLKNIETHVRAYKVF